MLEKFKVSNFKSFKENVSFSLVKNKSIDILEENTNGDLLKGILYVGPNASGKTNSISALNVLLEIVFSKCNISRYVNIFNSKEMNLKYNFLIEGHEIIYEITYNSKEKVISESFIIGDKLVFKTENVKSIELKEYLEDHKDYQIVKKFYNYLKNSVFIDLYNSKQSEKTDYFKNPKIIYDDKILQEINHFLINNNFDFTIKKNQEFSEKEDLLFEREGTEICIPYDMESIGNKTIIYIFPIFKKVIDNGGMLLLDEFGSGMHNELEELLIRYFMKNSVNSQIFFVSHSTNLLSQNLLRPDQIYSIDFEDGGSVTCRFSEEKPRSTQNLEKMYLGGVFGGLPNYNKE